MNRILLVVTGLGLTLCPLPQKTAARGMALPMPPCLLYRRIATSPTQPSEPALLYTSLLTYEGHQFHIVFPRIKQFVVYNKTTSGRFKLADFPPSTFALARTDRRFAQALKDLRQHGQSTRLPELALKRIAPATSVAFVSKANTAVSLIGKKDETGYMQVSQPGYSSDKSTALVFFSFHWGLGDYATGDLLYMKKKRGQWKVEQVVWGYES